MLPRASLSLRLAGLTTALLIAVSSALVFGGVASGPTTPVSAAAVVLDRAARFSVGAGQFARFTYRLTVAGGHWGSALTGESQIWVRGRSRFGREVEAASVDVPSIRVGTGSFLGGYGGYELVIGRAAYESPNYSMTGSFPGPPYALFMSPARELNLDPIDFVLSHGGAQTARFLERSLGELRTMATRPGLLSGHRVDVLTANHWPGTRTGPLVLYFDRKSHLLRGLDGRGLEPGAPRRRWSIRLVQAQMTGARKAWTQNPEHSMLLTLKRYESLNRRENTIYAGFVPIAIQLPSVADLRAACPGIHRLDAALWAGMGELGACRTVMPHITAHGLASALTAWDGRQLALAVRERIFSRRAVKPSLVALTGELLWDMAKSPEALKARARDLRNRVDKGQITRQEALNELL